MKALFIGPNLGAGGAERQWSILLPGLRDRGIDARLVALDGGGPFERPLRDLSVPVDVVGMRHQADIRRLARSPLIRRFDPDVVVTRGVSGMYVGFGVAQWRRAAHVYNEHRGLGVSFSRRRRAMTDFIARKIDVVIAVSPELAGPWIAREYPVERIVTVRNGVDAIEGGHSRLEVRQELGIPSTSLVALHVGRLRPEKQAPTFVRAVRQARADCPELIGLVAGEGPEQTAVEVAAEGDANIRLLGHRDDIPRLLAAADVFVLSSDTEALPMALLEAMAAGLAIVATNVGGIPDAVRHGESGLLVAPGDLDGLAGALATVAADSDLRARLGTGACDTHRERFGAGKMIDSYAAILSSAASGGHRVRASD